MGLLRTLVIAVILYYVWKIVKSLLFVSKANNIHRNFESNQNTPPHIKQKKSRNEDEEYVDYEEIK